MKYCIYLFTYTINGMVYVGQHVVKKEYPRQYMGKGLAIQAAMKEYGRHNFKKEILEEIEDDERRRIVSEREMYWIDKLSTMAPNGYNLHPGGIGGCTSESAKKIVSTRIKNGTNRLSETTKKKISETRKGQHFTEEHKQHLSAHHHLKTEHTIMFEDGHIENTTESIVSIAKRFKTSQNTLLRYSAKKQFINGIMLANIQPDQYACFRKYSSKMKELSCYDPIQNNVCSYSALCRRIHTHPEQYPNIVAKNCIIKKEGE